MKLALVTVSAVLLVTAGCTSSTMSTVSQPVANGGSVFVVGTDAPALAAVVTYQQVITSIVLTNSTTKTSSSNLLASAATVDFARYNGLQGLVDMNPVEQGTYDGATITLGAASLSYLNTGTAPPSVTTLTSSTTPALTLPSTPISVTLPNTLTVNAKGGEPVGLRIDLNLAQTIPTSGGNIVVNASNQVVLTPTFEVSTVARQDTGAHIDEFVGSVKTISSATASSFVMVGPHGEDFTINLSSSTEWDGGATEEQLFTDGTNAVVAVAGSFDPADQTLDADEVAILTDTNFYSGGLVTYVTPSTGTASEMQYYVRRVLPGGLAAVPLGGLADVKITGNENYGIYWMHNAFTNILFNDAALTPGQEVTVGGADPTGAAGSEITVKRIHLHNWGYVGTVKAGSENAGQGFFEMNVTGFAGQVIQSPILVYLGSGCDFRYGFGGFGNVTDNTQIRVVGILLKINGQDLLVARHIDGASSTNMAVTAWQ